MERGGSGEAPQPEAEEVAEAVRAQARAILGEEIPLEDLQPPQAAEVGPEDALQPVGIIPPQQPEIPAEEIIQIEQQNVPPQVPQLPNGRPFRFGDENLPDPNEEWRRFRNNTIVAIIGSTVMLTTLYLLYRLRIILGRPRQNGH